MVRPIVPDAISTQEMLLVYVTRYPVLSCISLLFVGTNVPGRNSEWTHDIGSIKHEGNCLISEAFFCFI